LEANLSFKLSHCDSHRHTQRTCWPHLDIDKLSISLGQCTVVPSLGQCTVVPLNQHSILLTS